MTKYIKKGNKEIQNAIAIYINEGTKNGGNFIRLV